MKALLINGSPRPNGCTFTALTELANTLEAEGIETEIVHVGNKDIRGCIACRRCHSTGSNKCVFDDIVNEVAPKLAEADAFVIGAPVRDLLYGPPVLQYPEHRQDHESGCFGRDLSARRQHSFLRCAE